MNRPAYDVRVDRFSFRRFFLAQIAFIGVLAIGTLGFVALTDEGWVPSFHRSVVTTTLTGLDSRPENQAAQIFTVVLLLAGVAIFLYLAGAVVELITRGVVGDYFGEGRRKRAIGQLRNYTPSSADLVASVEASRQSSHTRKRSTW